MFGLFKKPTVPDEKAQQAISSNDG